MNGHRIWEIFEDPGIGLEVRVGLGATVMQPKEARQPQQVYLVRGRVRVSARVGVGLGVRARVRQQVYVL